MDSASLADKVLAAFLANVSDFATRIVRTMALTKPALAEKLTRPGAEAANGGFEALAKLLPADLVRPCLTQLLAALWDILASYQVRTFFDAKHVFLHAICVLTAGCR